jgi:hypothetical protein
MKKLFFLTLLCIASSLLIFHSCSKDIDNNKVKLDYQKVKSDYKRPVNSTELTSILNNSKEVVLVNLSEDVKQSIIEHAAFQENRLCGFKSTDTNLDYLKKTNILEVLTAIFQHEVVDATIAVQKAAGPQPDDPYSFCKNCWWHRESDGCCELGGDGCIDF